MNLTAIPYWLLPTLLLLPAMLWMFLGVGLPWAFAVLPRTDWRQHPTLVATALALGPAITTTAMFIIGTFGHFTILNVLIASVLAAAVGMVLALRNRSMRLAQTGPLSTSKALSAVDVTLIVVVIVAVVIRFWNTAYWPYTTYDEFWVYGYNAKIFMLRDTIPPSIGYYPQLIPLAYTYGQLMWGGINDHAARVMVPIFALTSILMAYVLGARLFNRRVGLLTATIWALFPQQTAWSQFGDLEIPVTLYFTATATFFILGWRERNQRYVILSGLMLGAALWTKPTAFALPESLVLILAALAVYFLWKSRGESTRTSLWKRVRESVRRWFASDTARGAFVALAVGAPMGGMWYVRNILFGHDPIVLPAAYWQQAAARSGQELGWPLLIAAAGCLFLVVRRERVAAALGGLGLLLAGALPSAWGGRLPTFEELSQLVVGLDPNATTLKPWHLGIGNFLLLGLGVMLLGWAALPLWKRLSYPIQVSILLIMAFIAPYFVTWFWSYSYHPRLMFAIVPLLIVVFATVVDALSASPLVPAPSRRLWAAAFCVIIIILSLPGYVAGLTALEPALTGALPDDHARYASGNPALMGLVDYLADRRNPLHHPAAVERPMRIEVPGEQRLHFFFPLDDIRDERFPVSLDQIADVDYFIDSSVGQRLYGERDELDHNQILQSFTRDVIMQRQYTVDDNNFRYAAYTFNNVQRFRPPTPLGIENAQIGDFAKLVGYDIGGIEGSPGQPVLMTLWWTALGPSNVDYSVFIHLWDPRTNKLVASWGGEPVSGAFGVWYGVPGAHFNLSYHTRLWEAGETINDEWRLVIPDTPPGVYELRIGLFDPTSGQRLPVQQEGKPVGEWLTLREFTIR
jgi:Dolichyl-phosphate-mannose-protein mannosyltransferase